MILRAAFWITVVAVFIPREPDIGYGRPDAPSMVPTKAAELMAKTFKVPPCVERTHCLGGLSLGADLRESLLLRLQRAKADLKASDSPPLPF